MTVPCFSAYSLIGQKHLQLEIIVHIYRHSELNWILMPGTLYDFFLNQGKKRGEKCLIKSKGIDLWLFKILHQVARFLEIIEQYMKDTRVRRQNPRVSMSMVEVYNELVKDLLQVPGGGGAYLDLHETAEKGVHVKVSKTLCHITVE